MSAVEDYREECAVLRRHDLLPGWVTIQMADAAIAELAASRGLLQSRFDQEKAAHESLQAEIELAADRITLTGKLAKALKRAEQAEAEWKKWQHACGEAWVALGVARKELKRYKRGCRCEL